MDAMYVGKQSVLPEHRIKCAFQNMIRPCIRFLIGMNWVDKHGAQEFLESCACIDCICRTQARPILPLISEIPSTHWNELG